MFCRRCGTENDNNMSFCKECGAPLRERREPERTDRANRNQESIGNNSGNNEVFVERGVQRYENRFSVESIPPEYKPISMWGYFGYQLLFSIPLIGIILLLVFSFGGTQNHNLKNYARSYFCYILIMSVLFAVIFVTAGGLEILRYL